VLQFSGRFLGNKTAGMKGKKVIGKHYC